MGKKGKARQDKFYHLAKETGYRSRASFKLLQLNRKFEFLEKCRVCIDLCAAPGSWMQVAKQHMPVSSLIVGIDLFPIKPIPGCIALQEDITTEKCRQSIKKELKTWKADIVLHDGAPNVGQNWIYDAFVQNQLVLSALKLATEFLVPGGWFVTKVFRSKDYQSLMWVLQQLFKKVHSTKPMASRMESAEIFVVCQGYKAPDKLDPKFLDPKHVFQEVEDEEDKEKPSLKPDKYEKPRAEGYEDGVTILRKSVPVREFVFGENFIHVLNTASEIVMDDAEIIKHPLTTEEIKECCKDIKVLGRKDLKILLNWRKTVKEDIEKTQKEQNKTEETEETEEINDSVIDGSDEDEELSKIDQQVDHLRAEQERDLKRKKKKIAKERKKLQEKMNLKIILPGDTGPIQQETSLFDLKKIKSKKALDEIEDQSADFLAESDDDDQGPKLKRLRFEKDGGHLDSSGRFYREGEDSDEEFAEEGSDDEYDGDVPKDSLGFDDEDEEESQKEETPGKKVRFSDKVLVKEIPNKAKGKLPKKISSVTEGGDDSMANGDNEDEGNPLITDLFHGDQNQRRKRKADLWFDKDAFKNVEDEADEDAELDLMAQTYGKVPSQVNGKQKKKNRKTDDDEDQESSDGDGDSDSGDSDSSGSGSDFDVNEDFVGKSKKAKKQGSIEVVPQEKSRGRKLGLTPEALALGSMMIHSKKAKRDILDEAWDRYMSNETALPEWFVEDERRHYHRETPITKDLVEEYKNQQREVNVRPIKKVVEAKARKKKRALRRIEKAKKKASTIAENMGLSDYDKAQQIRQIYKKAMVEKKKDVTYVVAKRGQTGRRATRPAGVQGRYKMVDHRMKKDNRRQKAADRKKRGKKKRK